MNDLAANVNNVYNYFETLSTDTIGLHHYTIILLYQPIKTLICRLIMRFYRLSLLYWTNI